MLHNLYKSGRVPAGLSNAGCLLLLLLLCSCATEPSARRPTPGDLSLNPDAGRGGLVIATIQLENGRKLPVIVDTGSDCTLLDKSLQPDLGKAVGMDSNLLAGIACRFDFHPAPNLYLGGARLMMTGSFIACTDLKPLSVLVGCRVMGIIGMDVLEHYCLQLDFAAGKMRFLDDPHADKSTWGKAFPIVPLLTNDARPAIAGNLLGRQGPHSLVDSGLLGDGMLMPKYFQEWTNRAVAPTNGEARLPDAVLDGEKYPLVLLSENNWPSDGIGLNFLARHLVTFDFPNHTLYLRRQSIGPLPSPRIAQLKPIPDKEPEVTAHLRAVMQERIDGTGHADDYTAPAWKELLIKQRDIQANAKLAGDMIALTLMERHSSWFGRRRSYCYRVEFAKAIVFVNFSFDGRGKIDSVHAEAVGWKEPAE